MKKIELMVITMAALFLFTALQAESASQKGAQTGKEKNVSTNEEIMAMLSCMGYGYKVKVLINGTDVGIKGGMSEGKRLFDKGNEMAAKAAPDFRKNFVLVPGPNTIAVEYTREGTSPGDSLEVTFEMENYPEPLFKLNSKKPSGKVEKTISVQNAVPIGFKSVTVAE